MRGEGLLSGVGKLSTFAGALSTSIVRPEFGESVLGSVAKPEDGIEGILPVSRWRIRPNFEGLGTNPILRNSEIVDKMTRSEKETASTVLETFEAAAAPCRRGAGDALVRHIDWVSWPRRVACRTWEHA